MEADVLVVGAGPAGSVVAALLAEAGLRVRLVDKAAGPPPKVCREYLSPGCVPLLDRLGALPPLRDAGARLLLGMLIHTAGGQTLRTTYPRDGVAQVAGLGLARNALDRLLLDLSEWCRLCGGTTCLPAVVEDSRPAARLQRASRRRRERGGVPSAYFPTWMAASSSRACAESRTRSRSRIVLASSNRPSFT